MKIKANIQIHLTLEPLYISKDNLCRTRKSSKGKVFFNIFRQNKNNFWPKKKIGRKIYSKTFSLAENCFTHSFFVTPMDCIISG